MATETEPSPMTDLDVLVGVWQMASSLPGAEGLAAETRFEWLTGKQFLVQRWQIEHPDAPDGIAIIGYDADTATFLQHYFDSRGVARIYEMTLADGVWKLHATAQTSRNDSPASSARTPRRSPAPGRSPATARTGSMTST